MGHTLRRESLLKLIVEGYVVSKDKIYPTNSKGRGNKKLKRN